jgi:hypothetical protein
LEIWHFPRGDSISGNDDDGSRGTIDDVADFSESVSCKTVLALNTFAELFL